MKAKSTGPQCSYGGKKCDAVAFLVINRSGAVVSHLCATHKISPWGATEHPGLTLEAIGQKGATDEVGEAIAASGRVTDDNGPGQDPGAVEPGTWEPAEDRMERGQQLVPSPPARSRTGSTASDALPAGGVAIASPAIAPRETADVFAGASTLEITEFQEEDLIAPWEDEQYQIRDDGEIYMPWQNYATRLTKVLGPFAWALVPLEKPSLQNNSIFVRYALIVKGHFVADAVESHPYYPGNRNMTYDDAVESAKSECLRRLCKGRVGDLSAWDAAWRHEWKSSFAMRVWRTKAGRWAWRRQNSDPYPDEGKPGYSGESEWQKSKRLEDENQKHIDDISHWNTTEEDKDA